jgi:hypothetical protein
MILVARKMATKLIPQDSGNELQWLKQLGFHWVYESIINLSLRGADVLVPIPFP